MGKMTAFEATKAVIWPKHRGSRARATTGDFGAISKNSAVDDFFRIAMDPERDQRLAVAESRS